MPEAGAKRVLVLDDDDSVRRFYERLLKMSSIEWVSFDDPRNALDGMSDDIGMIITDMVMRGMDGISFIEAVRKDYPDVPIIMTTGYATTSVSADIVKLKVKLLYKPVSPKHFMEVIKEHMNGGA